MALKQQVTNLYNTAQKTKLLIKDFFSKCDQIGNFLRIWSHLLKKSLMETSFFVQCNQCNDLYYYSINSVNLRWDSETIFSSRDTDNITVSRNSTSPSLMGSINFNNFITAVAPVLHCCWKQMHVSPLIKHLESASALTFFSFAVSRISFNSFP